MVRGDEVDRQLLGFHAQSRSLVTGSRPPHRKGSARKKVEARVEEVFYAGGLGRPDIPEGEGRSGRCSRFCRSALGSIWDSSRAE